MSFFSKAVLLAAISLASTAHASICKTIPGDAVWPSTATWAAFNRTIGGQLIKPIAPGSPCHPEQPNYNAAACALVQSEWSGFPLHRADPVSSAWENYNNDTCNPEPEYSCSAKGYPAYVVNATCAEHVQAGVLFAAMHGIRLIVKGTGHDYMGRYA